MKKTLPLLVSLFLLGNTYLLKAQCYGYVKYDQSANGNGNNTFNINTTHKNELILVAYDGWPGTGGSGPVTVDGNNATKVTSIYNNYYSGAAQVYCYSAPLSGTHTIVCTETGYSSPYYLNMAAAFYDSATCTPLSCNNLTTAVGSVNNSGIIDSATITTTTPNELVFSTAVFNTGISNPYTIADTGATATATLHVSIGLDANVGYTSAPSTGPYKVKEFDPNTCVICGGAMVLVALIPGTCSAAFSVSNAIVQPSCKGNDGQIALTIIGGAPPFTYSWSPNVSSTANATGLSSGQYVVTISSGNDSCSTVLDSIKLVGPSVTISSKNTKCSPPNTGTATITVANGFPAFTYSWSNAQTNQTATGLTAGKYVVTVTDSKGCKFKDSVNVGTYPPPTISTSPLGVDTVCYDASTPITATGGISYKWLPSQGLSCNNCPSPNASPSVTTVYTVTGTDSNGCTNTAAISVRVLPLPKPIVTGIDTICIGTIEILNVTGSDSYVWYPGGKNGSSDTVRPPGTTIFTVTAISAIGNCTKDTTFKITVVPIPSANIKASKDSVCSGDSLTLTASGGTTYRWSPGNSTSNKIHINLFSATTYTLFALGGNCTDSTTITINVIQPISAVVSATKDSICSHGSTTITATGAGGAATYLWSTGATTSSITVSDDTVTTTYSVIVTGTCNSFQLAKTITVIPLPVPLITGTLFECGGTRDTLSVSSSVNPTTYKWSTGQTTTTIITGPINGNTNIYVTAYNKLGCSRRDTIHITEMPYPTAVITYPTSCGHAETIITAIAGGTGPFTYQWSTGGTNDTIDVHVFGTNTYTVTISNGCTITRTATIVEDDPILAVCCNTSILLGGDTVIVASGDILNYSWEPSGSLNCSTCSTVIASPTVTTTYTVSGTDSVGCPISAVVTILVETPCFDFEVPNVFTPTQPGLSGLDNKFYIQTKNIKTWSLLIYDRRGRVVFKSTNPAEYWDGGDGSGGKAPEGVYYYVIDATCFSADYKKNGFVQLIR